MSEIATSSFGEIAALQAKSANYLKKIQSLENELASLKRNYSSVSVLLTNLKHEKCLKENKEKIARINQNFDSDWIDQRFPWTDAINDLLKEKFGLDSFRPKQLAAINATLSKKDVLLVMPTGGGKSLVYQLPAFFHSGVTIVISPLISLIEDQLMSLNKISGSCARCINSNTPRDEIKTTYTLMLNGNSPLKLLYLTPEWVAKSKQFLRELKKCNEAKRVSRVAIDEVHCCSTWGHDFRPDYKFLGILRQSLENVPFLGLTATATMTVLTDVQTMLHLENSMIITAPFNRPNLFYKVVPKVSKDEVLDYLQKLLQENYNNQTGIIYTCTVSESINLASDLKNKGLKVAPYHAQMEAQSRQQIHRKWVEKKYQVVVATVAFGMGIDKPDVRFVIHHSMPRSMESLYQESGRAGRDGEQADCIVLFSLQDYLRVLANATSVEEGKKAAFILKYCIDEKSCRRNIIAQHFEETWEANHCHQMCDNCAVSESVNMFVYDIASCCEEIHQIINQATQQEVNLTYNKLYEAWTQTGGPKKLRIERFQPPKLTRFQADRLLAFLLINKYLKIDKGYTTYSTICYLIPGISPKDQSIEMRSASKFVGFRECSGTGSNEPLPKRCRLTIDD